MTSENSILNVIARRMDKHQTQKNFMRRGNLMHPHPNKQIATSPYILQNR